MASLHNCSLIFIYYFTDGFASVAGFTFTSTCGMIYFHFNTLLTRQSAALSTAISTHNVGNWAASKKPSVLSLGSLCRPVWLYK